MSKTEHLTAEFLKGVADNAEANIDWILHRMLAVAEGGDKVFHFHENLTEKQKKALTNKGFSVTLEEDRGETWYKITW